MQSHQVIKQSCENTSPKEVASELGVSLSLVYKWSQPNTELGSGSRNPLDRVASLIEITKDPTIIRWLCEQAGGYFVRNPQSHCEKGFEVMPATSEIVAQFGALLSEISHAAEDNSITNEESEAIRKVWESLKGYTEGFVSCCEEGDFEKIRRSGTP
ncbi:MAG: phage regulatory CII family protein [Verrucomicrobiales bacterium]